MANVEHLKILKSGRDQWNDWRKTNPNVLPDLSESNLDFQGMSMFNLTKVNLSRANLVGSNLTLSDLSYANLSEAKIGEARLLNVNLSYAILHKTNLSGSNLYQANLSGANLSESSLVRVNLMNAILLGSNLNHAVIGNTIFGQIDLGECKGLKTVIVKSPCNIDFQTLRASRNLPKSFLLKIGLPELFIDYLPEFYGDALNFYPVFLSHSWANKDFARKLYETLITKGVNVFFDEKKLKPGDDIYESISKGIEYYDKMILVCSKESLSESWWVDRELDRVLKKERVLSKERGKRINLLIPITIDDYVFSWDGAKAEEVRRYIIGDFKDWQDDAKFEKTLNDLIHALNADRPNVKPKSLL